MLIVTFNIPRAKYAYAWISALWFIKHLAAIAVKNSKALLPFGMPVPSAALIRDQVGATGGRHPPLWSNSNTEKRIQNTKKRTSTSFLHSARYFLPELARKPSAPMCAR